jgi:hypothetical protein
MVICVGEEPWDWAACDPLPLLQPTRPRISARAKTTGIIFFVIHILLKNLLRSFPKTAVSGKAVFN